MAGAAGQDLFGCAFDQGQGLSRQSSDADGRKLPGGIEQNLEHVLRRRFDTGALIGMNESEQGTVRDVAADNPLMGFFSLAIRHAGGVFPEREIEEA